MLGQSPSFTLIPCLVAWHFPLPRFVSVPALEWELRDSIQEDSETCCLGEARTGASMTMPMPELSAASDICPLLPD